MLFSPINIPCSFCKGRTLHSFVRDPKISLDINKTRQIAQEIIKVRAGYAKGVTAQSCTQDWELLPQPLPHLPAPVPQGPCPQFQLILDTGVRRGKAECAWK